jgi:hypothetical protein
MGRSASLIGLVRRAGGQIVLQMPANKALAVLPMTAYLQFRGHRDIAFIGPVTLDQARYAQFSALLEQSASTAPDDRGD